MGKPIPFKGFNTSQDGSLLKNYWSAHKDCKNCPLKTNCIPNSNSKKINRSAYGEEYQSAYRQQHSKRGKQMKRLRQSTVEPVFGSLVHYYGLNKIGVIGKPGANKVMLMSAIAFNLKKYMKFRKRKASDNLFKHVQKVRNHKYELDNALDQKFVLNLN